MFQPYWQEIDWTGRAQPCPLLLLAPMLERVFVSPAMHQMHHSREPRHADTNLGGIFAFWDWRAGTLYTVDRGETFEVGLQGGECQPFASVLDLYIRPLRVVAEMARGALTTPVLRILAARLVPNPTAQSQDEEETAMSFRTKYAIPSLAVTALGAVALTLTPGPAGSGELNTDIQTDLKVPDDVVSPQVSTNPDLRTDIVPKRDIDVLRGVNGLKLCVYIKDGEFITFTGSLKQRKPVRDGHYKLTNGGAVKVRNSRIVWDAFGVVERYQNGETSIVPPGLG
ncbi:MAG: sterol desaturase family protein [Gammaproteobacteria bacterium]|nr:sterol desaturase family protein [Gammaproteobacteria bacterium]